MKIVANKNRGMHKKPIIAASNDPTTTNLADFGIRELEELRDILTAWLNHGLPSDFWDDGVVPMLNKNSGYVFLTNSDYQTCMLADGKLESWYFTPYSGHEGFYEDLLDESDESWDYEDLEYLRDIAEVRNDAAGIEKLEQLMLAIGE